MTWGAAGIFAEIIASVAVLISLWYLAIQLKQNTDLARAELEVQLGVTWAEPYERYIVGVLRIDAVMGWWRSDGSLTSNEFKAHVDNLLLNPDDSRWRQVSSAEMVDGDA